MISIKSFVLIFAMFMSFTPIIAQSDFRLGYYITNDLDTVFGLIDYRGEIRNFRICIFKKDENSIQQEFKPGEIHSYRFIDSKYYISKYIPIGNSNTLVFAEYMLNGIVDLYYYRDDKEHYLIEKGDSTLMELTNEDIRVYKEGTQTKYYRKSNRYKGQLNYLFSDCEEISDEIKDVSLTHKSLLNISKLYHDHICRDESCIIYEKKLPLFKWQISPIIGISLTTLKFKRDVIFSNIRSNAHVFPEAGFVINMHFPRINEKVFLYYENRLCYYDETMDTNWQDEIFIYRYSLSFSSILHKNSFSMIYEYPKGKLRPFLGGGIITYIFYKNKHILHNTKIYPLPERDLIDRAIYFHRTLWGMHITSGVNYQISKRIILKASLGYEYANAMDEKRYRISYVTIYWISERMKSLYFNIGCYF